MARTSVSSSRTYSSKARNVLRALGLVLLLGGLFLAIHGGLALADDIASEQEFFNGDSSGPSFASFAQVGGGLFLVVFGLGALNAGFLGAQADYAAGETAGAVREFGSALRDDPSGTTAGGPRTGAFCPECGSRSSAGARFCDSCGHELVPA